MRANILACATLVLCVALPQRSGAQRPQPAGVTPRRDTTAATDSGLSAAEAGTTAAWGASVRSNKLLAFAGGFVAGSYAVAGYKYNPFYGVALAGVAAAVLAGEVGSRKPRELPPRALGDSAYRAEYVRTYGETIGVRRRAAALGVGLLGVAAGVLGASVAIGISALGAR